MALNASWTIIQMEERDATLEQFAREMPVEILAHPTLLPLSYRTLPIEDLWTEAREERAVAALKAAGIAFEVSNRYRPHQRFVSRATAAGVVCKVMASAQGPSLRSSVARLAVSARDSRWCAGVAA